MKKMLIVFLLLLGCSLHQLGVEEVSLTNRINFEEKMSKNEVFLKRCTAFDLNYAANRVYFVDKNYGHILVVELSSGKLVKTISSKGQGPAELHEPTSMRIRDGKIFVLDRGFGGIKMFDTEGRNLGQFRLKTIPWRWTRIDVNDKGEIFVGSLDRNDKSMVSVYDSKGTFLRALIKYKGTDLAKASRKKSGIQYFFKLDNDGNIVLLFYMLRQMAKYDAEGNQLWSVEIKNRILDEYPPELDKYNSNGKIY
ncbi:MAG: hypothetical protein GY765_19995, partial [bacterium]|nr:hypothetical protein [bacterium]